MPTPSFIADTELTEGRRLPAWWRRALATTLRGLNRRIGGAGNPEGAVRDLLPGR